MYLRNELDFWNVHGIMNTSGSVAHLVKPFIPKIEFITYTRPVLCLFEHI